MPSPMTAVSPASFKGKSLSTVAPPSYESRAKYPIRRAGRPGGGVRRAHAPVGGDLRLHRAQAQRSMPGNAGEVLVGAEQFEARRDAGLGDDAVDGAAYGDASVA